MRVSLVFNGGATSDLPLRVWEVLPPLSSCVMAQSSRFFVYFPLPLISMFDFPFRLLGKMVLFVQLSFPFS